MKHHFTKLKLDDSVLALNAFSIYTKNAGGIIFLVYSKCYYSISVRLTVILTVEKQTSECHLSKETNTMHIIQMAQEQHAIYFGYALVFGQFYRNRKGLKKSRLKKIIV